MDILIRTRRSLMKKLEYIQSAVSGLTELTATLDLLQVRWQEVTALEEKLDLNHQEISKGCDDKNYALVEAEIKASFLTVDTLKVTISKLRSKLTPVAIPIPTANPRTSSEVKLPKLELPSFSGDFMEWITFKDRFEASIHSHTGLKGAEKLTYLINTLEGEPKGMVKAYAITDANYVEAWNALNTRYQSEREIVSAILKKLFAQSTMREEASTLRKMIDVTGQCIRSLKGLKQPVDMWDAILIHVIFEKLDGETKKQWELSRKSCQVPKFEEFNQFLEIRSRSLAVMSSSTKAAPRPSQQSKPSSGSKSVNHGTKSTCILCEKDHQIHSCPTFISMSIQERVNTVKGKKLCFNCLRGNHRVTDCKSDSRCRKCARNHHTMIHVEKKSESNKREESKEPETREVTHTTSTNHEVLLGTAIILVKDVRGNPCRCRALLDPGSEATLISEECIRRLGIQTRKTNLVLSGVGSSDVGHARRAAKLELVSLTSSFKATVNMFVLPNVTQRLPRVSFRKLQWAHTKQLKLADPEFYHSGTVDVLLGADIVALILKGGLRKGPVGTPIAQETEYGWVLTGSITVPQKSLVVSHTTLSLEHLVEKFWEVENVKVAQGFSTEEIECEDFFTKTTTRGDDGTFTVCLPFQANPELGISRPIAERRFYSLERRLLSNPSLHQQYAAVIKEYIDLGQMSRVNDQDLLRPQSTSYYVPHHGVFKESSETTKLRVVFDASAKTSNGKSLNDVLKCGPKIQDDLIPILLRFRTHVVPIMGDAEKMYRMVKVSPHDYHYQRMLWRKSPTDVLEDYQMSVLMFGEKPAPWLATRAVRELATQEENKYPTASKIILRDLYVDDLISGGPNSSEVKKIREEVQAMMQSGGFLMRKWVCPDKTVMASIPELLRGSFNPFEITNDNAVKTLGIQWNPCEDEFTFSVNPSPPTKLLTKRHILSETAKIFDPLGWLAPVIIKAKILMQCLWSAKVEWDERVPERQEMEWNLLCSEFILLQGVKIPRCLLQENYDSLELHGFSDASQSAYGAVVYLKTVRAESVMVRLVASKTRVAPLSPPQSIPKLELSGALLLANLMEMVIKALRVSISAWAWTDSMIVLCWLRSPPTRWKTFIANRVGEILSILPTSQWGHVASEQNPADVCSRGVNPGELMNHHLWWTGPPWLSELTSPEQLPIPEVNLEEKRVHFATITDGLNLLNRYSSYSKLMRITAWIRRFLSNRRKVPSRRSLGPLAVKEIRDAESFWIRRIQRTQFEEELRKLTSGVQLSLKSKLLPLSPFIDGIGILRVGGRLQRSNLNFEGKHPILLQARDSFVESLVRCEHERLLHAGPELLMGNLRRRFWIINARMVVRKIYKQCVTCARHRGRTMEQLMGSLPLSRVSSQRAFMKTGVDFAGPFLLKVMKGRGQKRFKAYVCIFVCMTTRAMHVDLVSDLTTDAFVATLRRFVSRRAKPTEMWSDCGTNFIGANRELKDLSQFLNSQTTQDSVNSHLSSEGIQWIFNPPGAPHFGGMWEAGVRSVKYHLKRIMGNVIFTFEEMYTALTQIEACLNSRPLCPASTEPSDLEVLTPGHFLTGTTLTAVPDTDVTDLPLNRLDRWRLIQRTVQDFWKRWSREYLSRLQQRPKWWAAQPNLKEGAIVLIKDDNLPPLKWKMGRVIQVHPDAANVVRVATVKTADGELKRPIVKLAMLPLDTQEDITE